MIIFKHSKDLKASIEEIKKIGGSVGFVPTMGALHNGHFGLVSKSLEICADTTVSIFINPTQFNNPEDFQKYPVTIEKDVCLLEKNRCNRLFMPSYGEIYPPDWEETHYSLGHLENIWCNLL